MCESARHLEGGQTRAMSAFALFYFMLRFWKGLQKMKCTCSMYLFGLRTPKSQSKSASFITSFVSPFQSLCSFDVFYN